MGSLQFSYKVSSNLTHFPSIVLIFCCGGFGICCLVMKSLWANTFAVIFSILSPYPVTTALCLLPVILWIAHRYLLPSVSKYWNQQKVTDSSRESCCNSTSSNCDSASKLDLEEETKKTL